MKYPLGKHEKDSITSKTGKRLDDITIDEIKRGNVTAEDIKISKKTLGKQADVARQADNIQLAENFDRAAELVDVPDDLILQMYDKLRPNRSSKQELIDLANDLKNSYGANKTSELVLEAAEIYEKRGVLI